MLIYRFLNAVDTFPAIGAETVCHFVALALGLGLGLGLFVVFLIIQYLCIFIVVIAITGYQ